MLGPFVLDRKPSTLCTLAEQSTDYSFLFSQALITFATRQGTFRLIVVDAHQAEAVRFSANTFARHSGAALATHSLFAHARWDGFVHPADAEADVAVRINHRASLTGRRLYASIAEFGSSSLRR
jgi:hypothetical protein